MDARSALSVHNTNESDAHSSGHEQFDMYSVLRIYFRNGNMPCPRGSQHPSQMSCIGVEELLEIKWWNATVEVAVN